MKQAVRWMVILDAIATTLLTSLYALWVRRPVPQFRSQVEAALIQQRQLRRQRAPALADRERNGALDATYQSLWNQGGGRADVASYLEWRQEMRETLSGGEFCQRVKTRPSALIKSASAFSATCEELERLVLLPYFSTPLSPDLTVQPEVGLDTMPLASAVARLALTHLVLGQPRDALPQLRLLLGLARQNYRSEHLSEVYCGSRTLLKVSQLLAENPVWRKLSTPQLEELKRALQQAPPHAKLIGQCALYELLRGHNIVESLSGQPGIYRLPGMRRRELAILDNLLWPRLQLAFQESLSNPPSYHHDPNLVWLQGEWTPYEMVLEDTGYHSALAQAARLYITAALVAVEQELAARQGKVLPRVPFPLPPGVELEFGSQGVTATLPAGITLILAEVDPDLPVQLVFARPSPPQR